MKSPAFDLASISLLLDSAESDDLEFKSAKGGVPKSLWETYSAMANAYGGVIILGVEDDGVISGIKDIDKFKINFWNTLNNRGKVNLNLLTDTDVITIEQDNATILAIRVPRASRYQRPVFLDQNPLTGTYRRNYEGDYHCTEREVARMFSDKAEHPADSRILEHYTMADLDQPSLQQYRNRFASFKPTHPWLGEDEQDFLAKLGGWRKDRATGVEGITVAGLLMFGQEQALREALPQYHIDYREKLSEDPDIRWTDRLTLDGTWAGNLFQFYLHVMQRLSAGLKVPFQLDAHLFRKGETIVHEAIREALVNALIHADYQGMGGIVVEKYPDRFEFSNPGTLLVSMDQVLHTNISECRNKTLQTMFTMLGAAEKAGSGIDKIQRGWASQHWRLPRVTEQMQPDRVMWMLPMVSLIPDESLQRLKQRFGVAFDQFSSLDVQALVTADIEKRVDNRRLQQVSGVHTADITELFQSLVAKGALVKKGHGRWSWYHLSEVSREFDTTTNSLDSEKHSLDNATNSLDKDRSRELKKRQTQEETRIVLLDLCKEKWLSRAEISKLMCRNAEDLRKRFINPLVLEGLLQLRYPDKPNSKEQAYRTVSDDPIEDESE